MVVHTFYYIVAHALMHTGARTYPHTHAQMEIADNRGYSPGEEKTFSQAAGKPRVTRSTTSPMSSKWQKSQQAQTRQVVRQQESQRQAARKQEAKSGQTSPSEKSV